MDVQFPLGLTFDDVLLQPQASGVSRGEVTLRTRLTKKLTIQIPIIAAAMDTVSETAMAISLGKLGGVAVLHRNCSIEKQVGMLKAVKRAGVLAAAAVGPGDLERALALDKAGADVIVVDTAHAHNLRALKSAREIKKATKAQLIVGNIATREAAVELAKFADGIKVGIGPGSICTTRVVAGVGVPQLTAILNVVEIVKKKKIPVIADGGVRYSGDVVKALAAGASTVMLGSMLAGTKETPGKIEKLHGELMKTYRGMGSFEAMQSNRSSDRYFQKNARIKIPEGVTGAVQYKGPVKDVVEQITGGLRSGMGYIGARSIEAMWKQARFIRITNAGLRESHPHSITITKRAPNY
jgi:IMP dehydrogenase